MNCTGCGACCMGLLVRLNALERGTIAKEFQDGRGFLKIVDGRCVFLDPETRRCREYENRPDVCRRFAAGGDACRFQRAARSISEAAA